MTFLRKITIISIGIITSFVFNGKVNAQIYTRGFNLDSLDSDLISKFTLNYDEILITKSIVGLTQKEILNLFSLNRVPENALSIHIPVNIEMSEWRQSKNEKG